MHLLGVVISVGFLVDGPNVVVVCTVNCVRGAIERLPGIRSNISNPTMRAGLDLKCENLKYSLVRIGELSKCENLKYSLVQIGGFEMTSHTNKSLLKVRCINFDPVVQGLNSFNFDQYTSPGIQYYHVSKIKQCGRP